MKDSDDDGGREDFSPLKVVLLAVNGVSFGGLVVLLALGKTSGEVVILTIGTGLSLGAQIAGAIIGSRRSAKPPV